ncbi:RING-H2 finger protein ATL51-like [Vicia villosa]|uniref:RING-H2 finger protein ATL51-like n=1 Tax=Vicia villosa TaxID=3911 RepID=UPI00273C57E3|nr:RING-H2 finger protein ATL51-like [Vicia villosa]
MADGDHPSYQNVIVIIIAVGSAALVVVSMYRVMSIWFSRHQQSTTADQTQSTTADQTQSPPQLPQFAATLSLGESASSSIVHLIPTHKYHKRNKVDVVSDDDEGGTTACAVCLGDFEEGEELKTMPECLHSFHVPCIDMWLHSHSSCPVCRAIAAPSPAVNEDLHRIDMSHTVPLPIMQSGLVRF